MNQQLYEKLIKNGYYCEASLAACVQVALEIRPVSGAFLKGPAGCGKTSLVETLARVLGRELIYYQCYPGTREDDLLVKLIPCEESTSGIKALDGPVLHAAKASLERPVFLMLDEWDKTRPSADSFMLDFLQSGRICFNGRSCTANLNNVTVFIAMNDEREISESLLRRLPLIKLSHLPTQRVKEALEQTHSGHPYINSALVLYERCLMARMSKPATIQELRQLLDAITLLGEDADWNTLVFQFVTKTEENHYLLKQTEGKETRFQQEYLEKLDPAEYEEVPKEREAQLQRPHMPRISEVKKMLSIAQKAENIFDSPQLTEEEIEKAGGVISLTDDTYNNVVSLCENPTHDPNDLEVAKVVGKNLILKEPVYIEDSSSIAPMEGAEGEVVFIAYYPHSYIRTLQKRGLKIVKYSEKEILGKTQGIDFRALLNSAGYYDCEIIVDLQEGWREFFYVFDPPAKLGETDDYGRIKSVLKAHVSYVYDSSLPSRNRLSYKSEKGILYYRFGYSFKEKTLEEVKKEVGIL